MDTIIHVSCLKHVYADQTEVSACGLEFTAKKAERVTILGPNGAGKTTLLLHILGLLKPVEGTVDVMGMVPYESFNEVRKLIGVVFQNVDEQIIGPRVYDDIAFSLRSEGMPKEEVDNRTLAIAKRLQIEPLLSKIPHYLSGGQKKKVALAGALVMNPKILILDEPFDSLDAKSKRDMIAFLNEINQQFNTTIIITTHDINIVPEIADTIYVLNDGKIVTKGKPEEVFLQEQLLKEANLEVPLLTELFVKLKNKGLPVEVPYQVDEGVNQVVSLFEKKSND